MEVSNQNNEENNNLKKWKLFNGLWITLNIISFIFIRGSEEERQKEIKMYLKELWLKNSET